MLEHRRIFVVAALAVAGCAAHPCKRNVFKRCLGSRGYRVLS